jgi:hypothetical protein
MSSLSLRDFGQKDSYEPSIYRLGAILHVQSKPHVGTTFSVMFAFDPAASTPTEIVESLRVRRMVASLMRVRST